jgi:hypothetical protein
MTAIEATCIGLSNKTKKPNLCQSDLVAHTTQDRCPQHCQTSGAVAPTSSCSATPIADHQHRLPGPPSQHTTTRNRAAMPHDPAARSPSCTDKPPADHGLHTNIRSRRPDVKSTASAETCRPSRQARRTRDTRLLPKSSQEAAAPHEVATRHGSRGRRLGTPPPFGAAAPMLTS